MGMKYTIGKPAQEDHQQQGQSVQGRVIIVVVPSPAFDRTYTAVTGAIEGDLVDGKPVTCEEPKVEEVRSLPHWVRVAFIIAGASIVALYTFFSGSKELEPSAQKEGSVEQQVEQIEHSPSNKQSSPLQQRVGGTPAHIQKSTRFSR